MTDLNYARHLPETVFATANGHQGQALPPPSGTVAGPSGVQGRRCQNSQPRSSLFLSGVTPLSRVLHHFPGSVMLPKWCNAP